MNETEKALIARRLYPLYADGVERPTNPTRRSGREEKGQRQEVLKCTADVRDGERRRAALQPDPSGLIRGIRNAILPSLVLWAAIGFIAWLVLR
ncbi:MAG: hypothetical protein ACOVN5_07000 [Aquidulcibacter sp.]